MDGDCDALAARMEAFRDDRGLMLSRAERRKIAENFTSHAVDEKQTLAEIRSHYEQTKTLIDPHTAVARIGAKAMRKSGVMSGRIVTLSTAHPAKFPDAVKKATGIMPDLPEKHADLFDRKETMVRGPNDVGAIKSMIAKKARR